MLATGLTLFGFVIVLATVLPFSRKGYWWIRVLDFPRAQIASLGGISAIGLMLLSEELGSAGWLALWTVSASVAYHVFNILPYTRLYPKKSLPSALIDPECTVRLVAANVLQSNRKSDLFLSIVRKANPDVLCVLETDHWWAEQLRVLDKEYPYSNKCAIDNTYGMLLFSRMPFVKSETLFRVQEDIPSMRTQVRLPSGDVFHLHCLHPRPPLPFENTFERDAELVLVGKEIGGSDKPTIVIGDLNDVAWSHTTRLFQRLSNLLDPRIGRGMFSTFHADMPFLRYPLDHAFHSASFGLVSLRRLGHTGSDHFPFFIELCYNPHMEYRHEAPVADEEDHEQADEMVQEARERQQENKGRPGELPVGT